VRKQLLNELQKNIRIHQETVEADMTEREWVTNQDSRECIAGLLLYFMQEGNEGSPYIGTRNLHRFCSVAVSQENTAGTPDQFLQRHSLLRSICVFNT
jgi:hypothetical protein